MPRIAEAQCSAVLTIIETPLCSIRELDLRLLYVCTAAT
jgi:hypothetical protein